MGRVTIRRGDLGLPKAEPAPASPDKTPEPAAAGIGATVARAADSLRSLGEAMMRAGPSPAFAPNIPPPAPVTSSVRVEAAFSAPATLTRAELERASGTVNPVYERARELLVGVDPARLGSDRTVIGMAAGGRISSRPPVEADIDLAYRRWGETPLPINGAGTFRFSMTVDRDIRTLTSTLYLALIVDNRPAVTVTHRFPEERIERADTEALYRDLREVVDVFLRRVNEYLRMGIITWLGGEMESRLRVRGL